MRTLCGALIAAACESIAAHSRQGLQVVADVIRPDISHRQIFGDAIQRLAGLPVLFVGVRCPLETIVARRNIHQAGRVHASSSDTEPVPPMALWWDREIHVGKLYDIEIDTSLLIPEESAEVVRRRLTDGSKLTAFEEMARRFGE